MKLTHYILLSVFLPALLLCTVTSAQNLIPNGDFELGPDSLSYGWITWLDSTCLNNTPMSGPDLWTVTNLTPDRQVDTDTHFPTQCRDTTFAQSGNAYIILGADVVGADEAAKTTLTSPLEKDSAYRISYSISMQTLAGALVLPATMELKFNVGGNVIPSPTVISTSWQSVDTVFIALANSTEIEIVFGSGISGATAAGNIDNIVLVKESNTSISDFDATEKEIRTYPNPTSGIFYINYKGNADIGIYNTLGMKVGQYMFMNEPPHRFDFSQIPKGVYFIQIQTKRQTITQKLLLTK